jgi:hypothetical protein
MLYVRFLYSGKGYNGDGNDAIDNGLRIGESYLVDNVNMGQSHTSVTIKGRCYNSVLFEFEDENGKWLNIFKMPEYNPYLRMSLKRRGLEK